MSGSIPKITKEELLQAISNGVENALTNFGHFTHTEIERAISTGVSWAIENKEENR